MRVGCRELRAHAKLEITATCKPGGTMHGSVLRGAARLHLSTSFPSHNLRKLLRIDLPKHEAQTLCGAFSVGHWAWMQIHGVASVCKLPVPIPPTRAGVHCVRGAVGRAHHAVIDDLDQQGQAPDVSERILHRLGWCQVVRALGHASQCPQRSQLFIGLASLHREITSILTLSPRRCTTLTA